MLQIELLADRVRERQAGMRAAAASWRLVQPRRTSSRVWIGGLLIRLGRTVAGDPHRVTALQG